MRSVYGIYRVDVLFFIKMEDGINLKIERSAAEFGKDLLIGALLDPHFHLAGQSL